jgi:UDP-hydrolysing UDP-N-acetyl-D-glucosamine 2-epimerase
MPDRRPIKVCVVTGSRAEYGLMRWPMQTLMDSPAFDLQIAALGTHFDEKFGNTYLEIERDDFVIDKKISASFGSRSDVDLVKAVGTMSDRFATALQDLSPDLVLFMGDRYELLSVCSACVLMAVPMGHVSGGELTEGAIDEQIRHAVTKMAHLHFVANETYGRRVNQMGEETWRICISGEPGLDNVRWLPLYTKSELASDLGLDLSKPTALVTLHPTTLEAERRREHIGTFFQALENLDLQYVLTYPNADPRSDEIITALKSFQEHNPERAVLRKNLGQKRYLSALKHLSLMIGNSSSGIFEAPSFNMPAVNIGDRQKGRMQARNVFNVDYDVDQIATAAEKAMSYDRTKSCVNPYGDGRSSDRIADFIANVFSSRSKSEILHKQFQDLSC